MPTQVQTRRGTTTQHSTFTGAAGELTVDTDKKTVVVHDGSTAGGAPLLRENGSQNAVTTGTSTAASFIPTSSTVPTNGLYLPSAGSVAISTGGSGRLFVDASGNVGVGTSPSQRLHVVGGATTNPSILLAESGGSSLQVISGASDSFIGTNGSTPLRFGTAFTERMRLDSSGRLGIGSTSPSEKLTLSDGNIRLDSTTSTSKHILFYDTAGLRHVIGSDATAGTNEFGLRTEGQIVFGAGSGRGEAVRIDASKRLLVGTSSARSNFFNTSTVSAAFQLEGIGSNRRAAIIGDDFEGALILASQKSGAVGGNQALANNDPVGAITFQGNDGSEFVETASITAYVDGTPGANDMPGRLVFSTTADGASSPTERMRITNSGGVRIAQNSTDDPGASNIAGIGFGPTGFISLSRTQGVSLFVNRTTDDGALAVFRQDGTDEGSITVSGTTVSYNGAHLSRWSQLPSGTERTEILRGTVLSNIDEMCEWGDEENEQLNRMKVSDVEGDKNVSGVFQAWDDDDDTYTNDFYCAMTGDFIIRIGAGVTVERGDLLMSAGDGTAKSQDDDIIRSKTIAKVTSTYVSCTYDDGSYCVPCVLMAC